MWGVPARLLECVALISDLTYAPLFPQGKRSYFGVMYYPGSLDLSGGCQRLRTF